jgi:hypothetical protein
MRLFEVGEHVQEGLPVTMYVGRMPCVSLGVDIETKECRSIELGNSICRELKHPEDNAVRFRLTRASFDQTALHAIKLVALHKTEPDDGLALIVVARSELPEVPMNRVTSSREHTDPEHLTKVRSDGSGYDVFLFRPGNGLYIAWSRRLTGLKYDLCFVISWDGEELERKWVRGPKRRELTPVQISPGHWLPMET